MYLSDYFQLSILSYCLFLISTRFYVLSLLASSTLSKLEPLELADITASTYFNRFGISIIGLFGLLSIGIMFDVLFESLDWFWIGDPSTISLLLAVSLCDEPNLIIRGLGERNCNDVVDADFLKMGVKLFNPSSKQFYLGFEPGISRNC